MATEVGVSDWQQLAAFLQELSPVDLAFRGQGRSYGDNGRHVMKPRIDRCLALADPQERLRVERAVCQRFREHAPNYLSTVEKRYLRTPWLQLVVMQHYGAPKRLLDWTKSAWVAAYFAVSSDWESDGYMYGFRRDKLEAQIRCRFRSEVSDLVWGPREPGMHSPDETWDWAEANGRLFNQESLSCLSPWVATYYSREAHFPRLVAQQGLFTFGSVPDLNHWEHICSLLNDDEWWVVRIPSKEKPVVLRWLNTMGLNGATLFPGADGIGRSLKGFARGWHREPRPSQF
jgi:hypothetical protein